MKRFTTKWLLCATALMMGGVAPSVAQHVHKEAGRPKIEKRCGTMEYYSQLLKADPTLKAKWRAEEEAAIEKAKKQNIEQLLGRAQRNAAGEFMIPVVVHLIGNAGLLASIPDRDVYEQIEILNRDYAGKKLADYVGAGNLPKSMIDRQGNVPIRFVLARRNPQGQLSNGIVRVVSNLQITTPNPIPVKQSSTGGSDPWDESKYLNIWCAPLVQTGLLGIATFPFTTGTGPQGVTIDVRLLGANTCREYITEYNGGATLSHEVGHYFYLLHAWGDDGGACGVSDFRTFTGSALPDSANVNADDTPDEDDSRFGNVSGIFRDNCTNGGDGIFYNNFMNYFSDRSLFGFTKGQAARAQACLQIFRSSLITSNGATPPSATVDAYLVSSNPSGRCDTRTPVYTGAQVTALLRNYGTTTLTSAQLGFNANNTGAVTTNWTGTLAPGAETTVTIGNLPAAFVGYGELLVWVSNPNNTVDNFTHNDTISQRITVRPATITVPYSIDFSGNPTGWTITNPDNAATWGINTLIGSSATSPRSVFINCYSYTAQGQQDELNMPAIDFGTFDTSVLRFKYAYRAVEPATEYFDGLEVLVSGDDGATYTTVFRKYGSDLSTVSGYLVDSLFKPTFNDWRTAQIDLSPYIRPGKKLFVRFRCVNEYGQGLYLDDVSLTGVVRPTVDPSLTSAVAAPVACGNTFTAAVTLRNSGTTTLNGVTINYRLDNGTPASLSYTTAVPALATVQVPLPVFNNVSVGQHTITVWVSNPVNGVDANNLNDTVRISFFTLGTATAPLAEGFEGATFPPTGWGTVNPDNANTWVKATKASAPSAGDAGAALIVNYKNPNISTTDDLRSPVISYSGIDSVYMSFDVASATQYYLGGLQFSLDTLSVFVSTDCGQTLRRVYRKWGPDLQTAPATASTINAYVPANAGAYRRDSVNLTSFLPAGTGSFQVIFRNTSQGDNNVYVDNVNVYTKTLSAKLKENGYQITPTVTNGVFYIRQYQNFGNLRAVNVYNNAGARIASYNFYNQSGTGFMPIDLSTHAAGVYFVQLMFNDRNVTERVIKVNR